jgi:PilZ domain-containing protein
VEVECLACRARRRVALSSEEFRVLSALWRIERPCESCDETTEWSFAEAAVDSGEQLDFWEWLATTGEYFTPEGAAPPDERRSERRVEVHVPLLVSSGEVEEEVVSENISKNGVAFWSARTYGLGETVRFTLEPPGGAGPQTKSAVIVRANPPLDGKVLYGARLI